MKKEFTITVFTENKTGVMSRIIGIVSRRSINMESISGSKSSIEGIHKITIVLKVTEELVKKLVAQIDKQIDVLKSFYFDSNQLVYQELALYKIPTQQFNKGINTEDIIRNHNARILTVNPDYTVIEKTGHRKDTESLLIELRQVGVFEFVRSGRICVAKPMEVLNKYLENLNYKT